MSLDKRGKSAAAADRDTSSDSQEELRRSFSDDRGLHHSPGKVHGINLTREVFVSSTPGELEDGDAELGGSHANRGRAGKVIAFVG